MLLNPFRFGAAGVPSVLLLHMDGSNGSTTFTDVYSNTVTANGNAQISTAQSKFGGASGLFDGTGDYLTVPHSASLSMGSGDFTIETWFRPNSVTSDQNLINKQATLATASGYLLRISSSGKIEFYAGDSSTGAWEVAISGGTLSTATWYHAAATRQGSSWKLFLDGTQVGSTATASFTVHDNANSLYIGTNTNGSTQAYNGYLDELRITKGTARYTSNFTPSASAFTE
jgi:hypothetical protein